MPEQTKASIVFRTSPAAKKIAVTFGTITEFYLSRFLELNNVDPSNVTLVNVPLEEAQNALADGTVNAVITIQPYVNEIESSLGNKVVAWQAQSNQPEP